MGILAFILTIVLLIATPVLLLNNNTYQVALPFLIFAGIACVGLIISSFSRDEKRGFAIASILIILAVPFVPILIVMTVWAFGS